eukprot:3195018-Rhodomonas_salina.1
MTELATWRGSESSAQSCCERVVLLRTSASPMKHTPPNFIIGASKKNGARGGGGWRGRVGQRCARRRRAGRGRR